MTAAPPTLHERPRERLRRLGARALSLDELVALLVGAGNATAPAVEIARRTLEGAGGLRRLARMPPEALEAIPGVGPALAGRIVAALELGRRAAADPGGTTVWVRGPADVHRLLGPALRDLPHEEFHVLLLDTRHRLLRDVLVTRGILDASLIHPRELFRPAVAEAASSVILVHNHPSGDPTPSLEDRTVTRQLVRAGQALGIPVLDHVIVGDGCWRALAGEGGLEGV